MVSRQELLEFFRAPAAIDPAAMFNPVLLIEDDSAHAKLILRALKGVVGDITHVANGEQALRELEERQYTLVLSDLKLPDISGVELIRTIRNRQPHLPLIVLSSSSNLDDAVSAMRAGAWDYSVKTIPGELTERLNIVVERTAERQQRMLRELKLRQERDAFWLAAHSAQDGMAILGNSGSIVFANEAFKKFVKVIGRASEVGHDFNILDIVAEQDTGVGQALRRQLAEHTGDSLWSVELKVMPLGESSKENQRTFLLTLTSGSLESFKHEPVDDEFLINQRCDVLWVSDITRRKAQESFQRDLLATTSHDLKNPLGVVLTSSELLIDRQDLPQATREELMLRIASSARKSIAIIEGLLSARKIQEGMFVIRPEMFNLAMILEEICLDYTPMAKASSTALTCTVDDKEMEVFVDKVGLQRVLGNLIDNAIKFTSSGGKVYIASIKSGNEVRISITDNGPGIERKSWHQLFERYARLEQTKNIEGTGLGLFVSKSIIEAHGGHIEMQSEVGVGTTFTVVLPSDQGK